MNQDYDVVIVGAGLMGLAIANDLASLPLKIALIESHFPIECALNPEKPEIRASAINHSSEHYLHQLGIWSELQQSGRVLTYDQIEVKERDEKMQNDRTQKGARFSAAAADLGYPNLGYIIENQLIQNQLYHRLAESAQIEWITDSVKALDNRRERCFLYLKSGNAISAKLVIGADGAHSFLRQESGAKLLSRPYKHHAIVATIETSKPHPHCAKQLFYPEGIVAFLPLWQSHRHCLVWSVDPKKADELVACDEAHFNHLLTGLTEDWQGKCEVISDRVSFPLMARYVPSSVQSRLILIGDAAHTIHPLAGQGANLGLRDAQQLGKAIRAALKSNHDIGDVKQYQRYRWQRHQDALALLAGMQTIQDFFSGNAKPKKWLRTFGMNALDQLPFIKKKLIQKALGL